MLLAWVRPSSKHSVGTDLLTPHSDPVEEMMLFLSFRVIEEKNKDVKAK